MIYPTYNQAATEAAITGYGVLFSYLDRGERCVGIVWWDGEKRFHRGLMWKEGKSGIYLREHKKVSLVDGKIPAYTECPFRAQCVFAQNGSCGHQGINHTVPYSCASARGFRLLEK